MAQRIGDEEHEIEAKVEHTTEKAWLVIDTMSGKQAWLPKSQGRIVQDVDPDGNTLFAVTDWWYSKKSGFA